MERIKKAISNSSELVMDIRILYLFSKFIGRYLVLINTQLSDDFTILIECILIFDLKNYLAHIKNCPEEDHGFDISKTTSYSF